MTAGRRRAGTRRILPGRALAPTVTILSGQASLRAAGAPWWTICFLSTLALATTCLQIVFPQDSRDKVAWWSERRRTQRRHPSTDADSGDAPPTAGLRRQSKTSSKVSAVTARAVQDRIWSMEAARSVLIACSGSGPNLTVSGVSWPPGGLRPGGGRCEGGELSPDLG